MGLTRCLSAGESDEDNKRSVTQSHSLPFGDLLANVVLSGEASPLKIGTTQPEVKIAAMSEEAAKSERPRPLQLVVMPPPGMDVTRTLP